MIDTNRVGTLFYTGMTLTVAGLLFLLLLASCYQTSAKVITDETDVNALPHLMTTLDVKASVSQGILHPNGRLYFSSNHSLTVIDGVDIQDRITPPILHPRDIQYLSDLTVEPNSGLIYSLGEYGDAIHIISGTQLITTLVGLAEYPRFAVADEVRGEMYVFYTVRASGPNRSRALVLSGTTVITEMILPAFPNSAKYNPVAGRIYAVGTDHSTGGTPENSLFVIDNHKVVTTIQPLTEPRVSVTDIAINPENGDIYMLSTQIIYWDRVNRPKAIDLYDAGYKNLDCITVDPKRELAYVCSWMDQSNIIVVSKEGIEGVIPVKKWPESIAIDHKHDYIYVGHYDPTYLSVIRGTELITTLDIIGYGTSNVIVDEEKGYIYTANADDGTISIFGFEEEVPSLWEQFFPFMAK